MKTESDEPVDLDAPGAFINREVSWLNFAARVVALAGDPAVPLLERVKFAGIVGMLHDEFFMKRISGLKRQMGHRKRAKKLSLDGRTPAEELAACQEMLIEQKDRMAVVVADLRTALAAEGIPILDHEALDGTQREHCRRYFEESVYPILTPLAVDAEHPFPFISNLGLNLAVVLTDDDEPDGQRFVRIKVPGNRDRWVALPGGGVCPLEQVIAANLDLLFPSTPPTRIHMFRVTRGADGEAEKLGELDASSLRTPGAIVDQVTHELKARRFAGVVRVEVDAGAPKRLRKWLAQQLEVRTDEVYPTATFLGLAHLAKINGATRSDLRFPVHTPVTHPRLRNLDADDPSAIFDEIRRGDLLLHHPYHSFDTSVLRFIESAAADPDVLGIKLTIYRTSGDSPIVQALAEAARRGKQVAVLVEINARFDEAPNIAWGRFLEREGVHVSYGVESLKTHVKLALVVREEAGRVRRYVHAGTGNYHTGTARIYEDLGVLTADPEICEDASTVFNELTGATPARHHHHMLVAPATMRTRFTQLIRREAEHAAAGERSGITAKMNQLQDPDIIRELYRASRAGVPISLIVRGLCCLLPGVPGLSETIRVFSVVGRFLEHSRVYAFANAGDPEYYLGSADWMKRNLDRRVETVIPVLDPDVRGELRAILRVYEVDNASAWDCGPDGTYVRRTPDPDAPVHTAQEEFIARVRTNGKKRYQLGESRDAGTVRS